VTVPKAVVGRPGSEIVSWHAARGLTDVLVANVVSHPDCLGILRKPADTFVAEIGCFGFERSWQVLGASLGRLPTIPLVAGPNFPLITRYRNHPFVSLKSGLFSIKQCKLTEIYSLLTILIVLRVLVRHGLI